MDRHFDDELKKLRDRFFRMGLLVEQAVQEAVAALLGRNSEMARKVIRGDQEINISEIEIDEMAHELIALYQPAARDLRLITMVLKMTHDLERMGDQAVNIAEKVIVLNQEPPLKPYEDLPKMAEKISFMVRESLNAFMEFDADKAKRILESDDEIDAMNDRIYEEIQGIMAQKPGEIRTGVSLIMVSHNLERIADLATNLAEDVIYAKRGIDIRHHIRERREEN